MQSSFWTPLSYIYSHQHPIFVIYLINHISDSLATIYNLNKPNCSIILFNFEREINVILYTEMCDELMKVFKELSEF